MPCGVTLSVLPYGVASDQNPTFDTGSANSQVSGKRNFSYDQVSSGWRSRKRLRSTTDDPKSCPATAFEKKHEKFDVSKNGRISEGHGLLTPEAPEFGKSSGFERCGAPDNYQPRATGICCPERQSSSGGDLHDVRGVRIRQIARCDDNAVPPLAFRAV